MLLIMIASQDPVWSSSNKTVVLTDNHHAYPIPTATKVTCKRALKQARCIVKNEKYGYSFHPGRVFANGIALAIHVERARGGSMMSV